MRKKQSFLLTLLPSEESQTSIHGKIQTIATGRTSSFSNLDELYELLKDELKGTSLMGQDSNPLFSFQPYSSNPNIPK